MSLVQPLYMFVLCPSYYTVLSAVTPFISHHGYEKRIVICTLPILLDINLCGWFQGSRWPPPYCISCWPPACCWLPLTLSARSPPMGPYPWSCGMEWVCVWVLGCWDRVIYDHIVHYCCFSNGQNVPLQHKFIEKILDQECNCIKGYSRL